MVENKPVIVHDISRQAFVEYQMFYKNLDYDLLVLAYTGGSFSLNLLKNNELMVRKKRVMVKLLYE